jgi:hypothetical protein
MPPPEWKPAYAGDKFEGWVVRLWIRENERHIKGKCTFYPTWIEVFSNHYCGQLTLVDDGENHAQIYIWGTEKYVELRALEAKVKELKAQLEKARAISAGRLAKLKVREAAE